MKKAIRPGFHGWPQNSEWSASVQMRSISHANMRVQFTSLSHRSHRERQGVLAFNDIGTADLNCTPICQSALFASPQGVFREGFHGQIDVLI